MDFVQTLQDTFDDCIRVVVAAVAAVDDTCRLFEVVFFRPGKHEKDAPASNIML